MDAINRIGGKGAGVKPCLCGKSALEFWRHYGNPFSDRVVFGHSPNAGPTVPAVFPSQKYANPLEESDFAADRSFILAHDFSRWGVDPGDVHVLVPRKLRRKSGLGVMFHTCTAGFPLEHILVIDAGLCVVSPEYALMFISEGGDLASTLMLLYEFCGCYSIGDARGGLTMRHPLTSVSEVRQMLNQTPGAKGAKMLRKALPLVLDGSGSPQETITVLLLCLPQRYGGYGLPKPQMNVNIVLEGDAHAIWPGGNAFDMVWRREKVVVEYDGEDGHSDFSQKERDSTRRNALAAAGYSVFVLTKSQLKSVSKTYAIAKAVADRLGHRLTFRSSRFREKHLALRTKLLR